MESFKEYITELFDDSTSYEIKEIREVPRPNENLDMSRPYSAAVIFLFKAEKNHYAIDISIDDSKTDWEVTMVKSHESGFPKRDGMDITGDSSGVKETVKIFGTVLEALEMFLARDYESERPYNAKNIRFRADNSEGSRVKLYKRFAKKLNEKFYTYHTELENENDKEGFSVFLMRRMSIEERKERRLGQKPKEKKEPTKEEPTKEKNEKPKESDASQKEKEKNEEEDK